MKVEIKHKTAKPEKSVTRKGTGYEVSFGEDAEKFIVAALTNLYSDPEKAVVREILSNAYDASDEDSTVEIECRIKKGVTEYSFIDHGCGMSAEELKENYLSYGSSTKRYDTSQIGAYGFGAKSPLALANEFTVITSNGKEKNMAVVSKTEKGICGKITPLYDNVEKTGTIVKFDYRELDVNDLSMFPKRKVSVNGTQVKRICDYPVVCDLGEGWKLRIKNDRDGKFRGFFDDNVNFFVEVGDIAYSYKGKYMTPCSTRRLCNELFLTLEKNIGEVRFSPSREDIFEDDKLEIMDSYKKALKKVESLGNDVPESCEVSETVYHAILSWINVAWNDELEILMKDEKFMSIRSLLEEIINGNKDIKDIVIIHDAKRIPRKAISESGKDVLAFRNGINDEHLESLFKNNENLTPAEFRTKYGAKNTSNGVLVCIDGENIKTTLTSDGFGYDFDHSKIDLCVFGDLEKESLTLNASDLGINYMVISPSCRSYLKNHDDLWGVHGTTRKDQARILSNSLGYEVSYSKRKKTFEYGGEAYARYYLRRILENHGYEELAKKVETHPDFGHSDFVVERSFTVGSPDIRRVVSKFVSENFSKKEEFMFDSYSNGSMSYKKVLEDIFGDGELMKILCNGAKQRGNFKDYSLMKINVLDDAYMEKYSELVGRLLDRIQ